MFYHLCYSRQEGLVSLVSFEQWQCFCLDLHSSLNWLLTDCTVAETQVKWYAYGNQNFQLKTDDITTHSHNVFKVH